MPKHLIEINSLDLEKALVVVVHSYEGGVALSDEEEMLSLVSSAGCKISGSIRLNLHKISAALFIGRGQAEEIAQKAQEQKAEVVIFNVDLSFVQQANLEDIIGVKTIDRTQLILDIFARRAKSSEGKLQVELAQLEYLLPRLKGKGIMLSRLGGGIGTRGPGEKKLEVDRRRIMERIRRLKLEINDISRRRSLLRHRRQSHNLKTVSLVGYTNAGKTTLFNLLSQEEQKASRVLFTTLDPLSRRLRLETEEIILTDTVGFIKNLPPKLRQAFSATLEELNFSHLLLQVVDGSKEKVEEELAAVEEIMADLGLSQKRKLLVFNKTDKIPPFRFDSLRLKYPNAVFISALKAEGLGVLKARIRKELYGAYLRKVVLIESSQLPLLAQNAVLVKVENEKDKLKVEVEIETERLEWLQKTGAIIV